MPTGRQYSETPGRPYEAAQTASDGHASRMTTGTERCPPRRDVLRPMDPDFAKLSVVRPLRFGRWAELA